MTPTIYSGEVLKTSTAYGDTYGKSTFNIPIPGSIKVALKLSSGRTTKFTEITVVPLNPYSYTIPLIGEHVLVYKSISAGSSALDIIQGTYYYGDVIPGNFSLHQNAIIGTTISSHKNNTSTVKNYNKVSGTPSQNKMITPVLGESFTDTETPQLPTQPYEGDYLIQGRNGQSIRLGSSFNWQSIEPFYYKQQPKYKGLANSPIIILRTPPLVEKQEFYSVENPGAGDNTDAASIYLTSNQEITGFMPAHGIGKQPTAASKFKQPQVLITSDRIIFNAKNERAFIIGKIDVAIVTKDWAMMMNEFFEIVRELLKIFGDQGGVSSPYALVTSQGATLGSAGLKSAMTLLMQRMDAMKQ